MLLTDYPKLCSSILVCLNNLETLSSEEPLTVYKPTRNIKVARSSNQRQTGMSLTGVAVLCLLVVGVWGQCCPPDVYEVTQDVYAEVRKNGTAEITRVRLLFDI